MHQSRRRDHWRGDEGGAGQGRGGRTRRQEARRRDDRGGGGEGGGRGGRPGGSSGIRRIQVASVPRLRQTRDYRGGAKQRARTARPAGGAEHGGGGDEGVV